MRTYLVVVDDSNESRLAQSFAGRRAARTNGNVHLLVVTEPSAFVAWGGVQETMESEAREKAEAVAMAAAEALHYEFGVSPKVTVRQGEAVEVVRELLMEEPDIAVLVLGAAESGPPGPLVSHFSGPDCGLLPVPLMIIPGSLSPEDVARLS